jgi:hypothetical protein
VGGGGELAGDGRELSGRGGNLSGRVRLLAPLRGSRTGRHRHLARRTGRLRRGRTNLVRLRAGP